MGWLTSLTFLKMLEFVKKIRDRTITDGIINGQTVDRTNPNFGNF